MKAIHFNYSGAYVRDQAVIRTDGNQFHYGEVDSGTRLHFEFADNETGGAHLTHQGRVWDFALPASGSEEAGSLGLPDLQFLAASWPHGPLGLAADCFVNAAGHKTALGLSSDFREFQRFLHGEDLTALKQQRHAAGSQGSRTFGTCVNLFPFDPRDHGDYYDGLRRYTRWLAGLGEWLHFTACTDVQLMRPGFDVRGHWEASCAVLADEPNVVVTELVNEFFKNGVDPTTFSKPAKAPIVSCGSFVDGQFAPAAWGDVLDFHPSRNADKWDVTVPQTVEEIRAHDGAKPVWIGEPMGAAATPRGDRSTDAARFERLGVACGVFAAGGVAHSDAGCQSVLWSEVEAACMTAFFRGVHR